MSLLSYSSRDTWWQRAAPLWVSLFFIFASILPFFSSFMGNFFRALVWVSLYIFMVYRISSISPFLLLIVGLLQDVLYGFPVGVHIFPLFMMYIYVLWQYTFLSEYDFLGVFGHFALIFLICDIVYWGLIGILLGVSGHLGAFMIHYIVVLFSYVIAVPVLNKIFELSSQG